jgi:hypothetical protein
VLTTVVLVAADIQPTAPNTLAALGDFLAAGCYIIAELAAVMVAGLSRKQRRAWITTLFRL